MIRRGEVYWIVDRGKRRPGAVVTRDQAIPLVKQVMVAPATTTIRRAPTEVLLGRSDGMDRDCVLSMDNLRAVPVRALKERITTLGESRMDEVCAALVYTFGCA